LVPLCGINIPLQSVPPSSLIVYPHLSITPTPVSSLEVKHNGSASERLMLREALYKWTHAIPYSINNYNIHYFLPIQFLPSKYSLKSHSSHKYEQGLTQQDSTSNTTKKNNGPQ